MEAIRVELDFLNSTMHLQLLSSGKVLTKVTRNIAPEHLAMMEDAGADAIDLWGGAEVAWSIPLNRPAVLTRVNPRFDVHTTTNRYYLAFAKPQRIIDVLAIGLARDEQAIVTLSFGRHERAGPIGEREITIAGSLIPHLQRAATINRMLEVAGLARASFEMTLDGLTVPVALVDRERRVVHANPAARRLLDQGDPVRLSNGVLDVRDARASSALAVAITQAASDETTLTRRGLGIPLHGRTGAPGALHVLPLRAGRPGADTGAVAAVFVAQADTSFVAPTEVIAELFDLTPAEARIFRLIGSGQTIPEAAAELGIERCTVKTHLLRVYGKVGVKRQGALVRIAASLAPPVVRVG